MVFEEVLCKDDIYLPMNYKDLTTNTHTDRRTDATRLCRGVGCPHPGDPINGENAPMSSHETPLGVFSTPADTPLKSQRCRLASAIDGRQKQHTHTQAPSIVYL